MVPTPAVFRAQNGPRRLLAMLLTAFCLWAGLVPVALAADTLDQKQELVNGSLSVPGSFSQVQSFTAGLSGRLTRVSVHVANPSLAVDLTVQVQTLNQTGTPSGIALASQSLSLSPGSARWVEVAFDQALTVTAGSRYGLVLQPTDSFAWSTDSTAPYAGGEAWTGLDGDWWSHTRDYAFRTYVSGGNAAPAAAADEYTLDEDTALSVPAPGLLKNDHDPDGDPLTAVVERLPQHGTLDFGAGGSFLYTPNPHYAGTDTFGYSLSDGELASDPATVTLRVRPVNDPPSLSAIPDLSVQAGEPVSFNARAADPDSGDSLTYALAGAPAGAAIDALTGQFTWTPDGGQVGSHRFSVQVTDAAGEMAEQPVSIQVSARSEQTPRAGKVSGGGWVAGGPKGKGIFAFEGRMLDDGTLKGKATYTFQGDDGIRYLVRCPQWTSLTVGGDGTATFAASCTVNRRQGRTAADPSGYALVAHLVDGKPDQYLVTITDAGGNLWHQAGGPIGGGQVKVRAED